MPYTTYNPDIIADFFRACTDPEVGDVLSNLKLQKLCYYAAGIIAALRTDDPTPLFDGQIEAWAHGPVVPSQYRRFAQFGSGEIKEIEDFDFDTIEDVDKSVLNDVYKFYGQYSAWKLRNMTHEEPPWINAYVRSDKSISQEELAAFFCDEVTDEYIRTYREATA